MATPLEPKSYNWPFCSGMVISLFNDHRKQESNESTEQGTYFCKLNVGLAPGMEISLLRYPNYNFRVRLLQMINLMILAWILACSMKYKQNTHDPN